MGLIRAHFYAAAADDINRRWAYYLHFARAYERGPYG